MISGGRLSKPDPTEPPWTVQNCKAQKRLRKKQHTLDQSGRMGWGLGFGAHVLRGYLLQPRAEPGPFLEDTKRSFSRWRLGRKLVPKPSPVRDLRGALAGPQKAPLL